MAEFDLTMGPPGQFNKGYRRVSRCFHNSYYIQEISGSNLGTGADYSENFG